MSGIVGWIVAGALLWAILSVPAAIVLGRMIRLADFRERTDG